MKRTTNVLLWVVQVITAAGFVLAALGKLTGDPHVLATFHAIGLGAWFRYLIATLELLGAAALLVPRLAGLAGLAFVALMIGAVATQLATGGGLAQAIVMLLLSVLTAWGRRPRGTRTRSGSRAGGAVIDVNGGSYPR